MSLDWSDAVAVAALGMGVHQYWRQSLRRPVLRVVPPRTFTLQRVHEVGPYAKPVHRWMLCCPLILTNEGARTGVVAAMRLRIPAWQDMVLVWTATHPQLRRSHMPVERELASGIVLQPHSALKLVAEFQYGGPAVPRNGQQQGELEVLVREGSADVWRPIGELSVFLEEPDVARLVDGEEVSVSFDPFRRITRA